MAMSSRLVVAMAKSLRTEQLSLSELGAIHYLGGSGPSRVNVVADAIGPGLPAMSRIATGLLQRGLVERTIDPADGRAKLLTLSPAGHVMLHELGQQLVIEVGAALQQIEGGVSDHLRPVFEVLQAQDDS